MTLGNEEFRILRDMINEESGIYFADAKMYFLDTRLQSRMQTLNCSDVREYIEFLKFDKSKSELDQLIDLSTTNETFFFRDLPQIDAFAEETIPALMEKKRKNGDRTIRIWSAACSTGEEAYTMAMILRETIEDFSLWNIQIIATDISCRVLMGCRAGVYPVRSLKDTPPLYKEKYFSKEGNLFKISPEIKKMVQFSRLNLLNRGFMRAINKMDCIFCRNVLVYFDKDSAKKVINSLYDSLNPGGVIFLGFSESMHQFSAAFNSVKYKKSFAHMKE